jgi:hypothetical protein
VSWRLDRVENGSTPAVLYWSCSTCGGTRFQYGNCTNVETMCRQVLDENLRKLGAHVDTADALSYLEMMAWRAYVDWDPERGVNYEGWAFSILRKRAFDLYRMLLGRNGERANLYAVSLDAEQREDIGAELLNRSMDLTAALR